MAEKLTPNGLVVGLIPDEEPVESPKAVKGEDALAEKQETKRSGRQKADK